MGSAAQAIEDKQVAAQSEQFCKFDLNPN